MAKISIERTLLKAKSLTKKGELAEAMKLYTTILVAFPNNKKAQQGQAALAKANQSNATQSPPQEAINQLANLFNQGQLAVVARRAEALTKPYQNSFVIWSFLGGAYQGLGQAAEAAKAFRRVIELNPHYPEGHNNLGIVLQQLGKSEASVKSFQKALSLKPDYSEAYYNMGIAFKELGKLDLAIGAYQKSLALDPTNWEAYGNMGLALKDNGDWTEAVVAYEKALAVNPNDAELFSNMGNAFKEQGRLEEAIAAYNKALSIKPDYTEAYNNMGNAFTEQGKLEEAIEAYNKTLAIKPDYTEAYYNKGNAFKEQGKHEEAIAAYSKALSIKPDYAEAYYNIGITLMGIAFQIPDSGLQKIITSILDHKTYVRPTEISQAAISLLKVEPEIKKLFEEYSQGNINQSFQETVLTLSELPLLLKLMSICPLADFELEAVLSDIRFNFLSSVSEKNVSSDLLRFQSALALQCFTNEYIYNQNDTETKALQTLEAGVGKALSNGQQPNPQSVLCLASYKALHEYEWCNHLAVTADIEDVFTRQVLEPKQEARMKLYIPALEKITDKVSSKVREQYEVSPYPRWVNLGLSLKPATISKVVSEIKLRLFDNTINVLQAPNILIAGCGTGQQSIEAAARFENSKILAIDLSLSSLAYAKRKTEELGIENIKYMQADILDLGNLDRQFDIVESAGVLHHMEEPMVGWRVLTDCLKPGGLMKIGLYSELARQHIRQMREEITQSDIGSSDLAMRSFRSDIIKSGEKHHKKILSTSDFYCLSELRDLLFHVQEHRFTISLIKDCLSELGLKFCGFESDKLVQSFKLNNTRSDDPYDLDKWNSYEKANPNTFMGMYQFWCQKIA